MPYVCLLLSGAALLVNGVAALGRLPRRDAAVLSLLVGGTQLVLAVVVLSQSDPTGGTPLTAAGMVLFGLTYAYVGLDTLLALGSKGLGWFCGLVAFVGLLLAAAWLVPDPLLAVLWLGWAVLWGLFFASMALGLARLDGYIGWALVLASQVTATIPAVLGLSGLWPQGIGPALAAATALALLFAAARLLARRPEILSSGPRKRSAATRGFLE